MNRTSRYLVLATSVLLVGLAAHEGCSLDDEVVCVPETISTTTGIEAAASGIGGAIVIDPCVAVGVAGARIETGRVRIGSGGGDPGAGGGTAGVGIGTGTIGVGTGAAGPM